MDATGSANREVGRQGAGDWLSQELRLIVRDMRCTPQIRDTVGGIVCYCRSLEAENRGLRRQLEALKIKGAVDGKAGTLPEPGGKGVPMKQN